MDERLREAQRAAAEGGPVEQAALLREQLRAGVVTGDQVLAQAVRGDEVALLALGLDRPQAAMLSAAGGIGSKIGSASGGEQAIRAYYRAKGYQPDRFGALVGTSERDPNKMIRLVFKQRVVEEFHGRPGAWRKHDSLSLVKHAQDLLARAQGGAEKLKEVRKVRHEKAVIRKKREADKRNVFRTAAVLASIEATPEMRHASLTGGDAVRRLAMSMLSGVESQLSDEATPEQIDAMLSVSRPPVFMPEPMRFGRRTGSKPKIVGVDPERPDWPTSYKWTDPASGFPIEFKRSPGASDISIIIGNVPVDPVSGRVIPSRMFEAIGKGYTGLAGTIRTGDEPQAQLYYIQSQERRAGVARRMIRLFCRLVSAYGFKSFVALGVGPDGMAMILGLHDQGELVILGRRGSNIFVRCAGALEDPRQQLLFGPQPKPNR